MKYVDIDNEDGIILTIKGEPVAVVGIMPKLANAYFNLMGEEPYDSYDLRGYALRVDGRDVSNFGFATARQIESALDDVTKEYARALEILAWNKEKLEKAKLV
jgi:hypothetical protein